MPTTAVDHTEAVRRSIEAWNRGDVEGYANHFAPDGRLAGPMFPEPLVGRENIRATSEVMDAAFPGMQWSITSMLQDGDRVVCELHIEGTQSGPLPTPDGVLEPTGRHVSFDIAEIREFDENGLIKEYREYMDTATLMGQLGQLDAPAAH